MMLSRRAALAAAPALVLAACGRPQAQTDTLRVGLPGMADSLDPLRAEFAVAALMFRQIFLPVTRKGPDGTLQPAIAAAWEMTPDAKRWTFTLAPGLFWSDGTAITVEDVVGTFRLAAAPATVFTDAGDMYRVKGFPAALRGELPPDQIGVTALDQQRFQVDLDVADADFAETLSEFYPVPVAVRATFGEDWTDPANIVVSGAYKPVRATQTDITLEANPRYRTPPGVARVFVQAIDDASTRSRMFRAGDLDIAADPPLSQLDAFEKEFAARLKRFSAPRIFYLSFNTRRPPFDNAAIRRALAQTVDRDLIVRSIFRGAVDPAYQLLRGPARHGPQGDAAFDAARAALREAGYGVDNPLRLELLVVKDERERVALLIQDMWRPLGVEATIFGSEQAGVVSRLNEGDFDMGLTRLDRALKDSPLEMLEAFNSRGTAQSHGWRDAGYDALLDRARAVPKGPQRDALVDQADALLAQAAPIAPLYYGPALWLIGDRVQGADTKIQPVYWERLSFA